MFNLIVLLNLVDGSKFLSYVLSKTDSRMERNLPISRLTQAGSQFKTCYLF